MNLYKTKMIYEYGEDIIDLKKNVDISDDKIDEISWEIVNYDEISEVGNHIVKYHYRDTVKICTIVVKDTTKPIISCFKEIKNP